MSVNGQAGPSWAWAVQGKPTAMLEAALRGCGGAGPLPQPLAERNGDACGWVRRIAQDLGDGTCRTAVVFCEDASVACCVANKVPGVRAAAVTTVSQATRALAQLGANLLLVEMAGRTFFEFKQLLRLAAAGPAHCPPGVACTLTELDGHAHR